MANRPAVMAARPSPQVAAGPRPDAGVIRSGPAASPAHPRPATGVSRPAWAAGDARRTLAQGAAGAAEVLDLQRLAGNGAVAALLASPERHPAAARPSPRLPRPSRPSRAGRSRPTTVQRNVVDDLGTNQALNRLARLLDDDQESNAIEGFRTLDAGDTDTVLRSDRWRDLATGAFDNAEMHRAMMATGTKGLLWHKLIWEFDEGTSWGQLRALIDASPAPQRRQVITERWFRGEFSSELGNYTMGEAVRHLGPPLRNQLDWMIDEGVDRDEFDWLIEESSPAEIYDASRDLGLMARLRAEVGTEAGVVSALEAARGVAPTGTTPVGPRWTADDARTLAAQSARVGVISPRMAARVPGAVTALVEADYTSFRGLLTSAGSDTERAFIAKALASGHTVAEVTTFATAIRGMSDAWLIQNLNVLQVTSATDTGGGTGIIQQFGNSCGPTSVQVLRAEADPIYAFSLNSAGPIGQASADRRHEPGDDPQRDHGGGAEHHPHDARRRRDRQRAGEPRLPGRRRVGRGGHERPQAGDRRRVPAARHRRRRQRRPGAGDPDRQPRDGHRGADHRGLEGRRLRALRRRRPQGRQPVPDPRRVGGPDGLADGDRLPAQPGSTCRAITARSRRSPSRTSSARKRSGMPADASSSDHRDLDREDLLAIDVPALLAGGHRRRVGPSPRRAPGHRRRRGVRPGRGGGPAASRCSAGC